MGSLYSVAEIRAMEQAAAAALPAGTLMRRAGRAAADLAHTLLGAAAGPHPEVLLLAGPGNNGGDALETAANLAADGVAATVVRLAGAGSASLETAQALLRAERGGVVFATGIPAGRRWALVVDGLFGIGLTRPIDGPAAALIRQVNALDCPVLALDVPSGLNADTGAPNDGATLRATHTLTFIGDKPGLHTGAGRDDAGLVSVATLEVAAAPARARLNAVALFAALLRPRENNSHKGSYGDVVVVGGARGMAGAPVLASRAALFAGAGRVFVAAADPAAGLDWLQPEIMYRDAEHFAFEDATVVAGCGLGQSAAALALAQRAVGASGALVLDADALNLLAAQPALQTALTARRAPTILTPHPLEAARLLACTSAEVQHDRLAAARTLAARFAACVVLKGSGTVLARPDGEVVLNPTGNPGLATAGTGDVLAGLCASLLAQGWPVWEAALGAVWLHGAAADRLVAQGAGPIGLCAGELAPQVRALRNALVAELRPSGRPQS